jgi:polysaccharide deacetylase family protein (PEP-CTERM system associated)
MIHCFSVDVEGFCEGMAESVTVPHEMIGGAAERREIEANVGEALEWLEQAGVRGTFFTLGVIAEALPRVVRRIADHGHEIASHSHRHLRLYNLELAVAREEIVRSKKALEDATGREVLGFRAPDFSITRRNLELLDALREAGYRYDSSIFPISFHDVYGVAGAGRDIHRLRNGLIEFPPATCRVFRQTIPVLGGGYFRLSPLWLSRSLFGRFERVGRPVMSYIHPYEIAPGYPRLRGLSWKQRFRHYVNIDQPRPRYTKLFQRFRFGRAIDVLAQAGFDLTGDGGSRAAPAAGGRDGMTPARA